MKDATLKLTVNVECNALGKTLRQEDLEQAIVANIANLKDRLMGIEQIKTEVVKTSYHL